MSSEKPFWEGKTCTEMAGLHVKVTFKEGTVATGVTTADGDIKRVFPLSSGSGNDKFIPRDYIESIELVDESISVPDDPEYERIDDIHDVCTGDIFVATNGNRFSVVAVDDDDETDCTLAVMVQAEIPDFHDWMFNSNFAYALRRKPKLPDHDGLWWDKDNALWSVAISGLDNSKLVALLIGDPESPVTGSVWSGLNSKHVTSQAPFRPAKVVEA